VVANGAVKAIDDKKVRGYRLLTCASSDLFAFAERFCGNNRQVGGYGGAMFRLAVSMHARCDIMVKNTKAD
jgi:hypothetical protein